MSEPSFSQLSDVSGAEQNNVSDYKSQGTGNISINNKDIDEVIEVDEIDEQEERSLLMIKKSTEQYQQ